MNEVVCYSCNMIHIWIQVFCFITPSYVVNCLQVDTVIFQEISIFIGIAVRTSYLVYKY